MIQRIWERSLREKGKSGRQSRGEGGKDCFYQRLHTWTEGGGGKRGKKSAVRCLSRYDHLREKKKGRGGVILLSTERRLPKNE